MIHSVNRQDTHAVKYENRFAKFGREDIIPLWVADSEYASPPCVVQALQKRAAHPLYGYTATPDSLFESFNIWCKKRYNWSLQKEDMITSCGVVTSLYAAVLTFTNEGDKVIIQPPVYPPFAKSITDNGRVVAANPLIYKDHVYTIDFENLEKLMQEGAKLILFCSPHNPVGRVWLPTELSRVIQLCEKYNVILFSDEIHADIVSCGIKHTPIDTLSDSCQTIVATSPSKSFNIAGLGLSLIISRHHDLLQKLTHTFSHLHIQNPSNPFSLVAFEAAYKDGEEWLEEMNHQIDKNEALVRSSIQNNALPLIALKREGSFLLWIDCSLMGLSPHEMRHFFIEQAKVGFSAGVEFGKEGAMFVRLNLATSPQMLLQAFDQITDAWRKR